jgi:hypothetical protein
MSTTSNAYYEIPLEKEREEDQAEAEALSLSGQCYCHLTMHSSHEGHSARPCHVCEEEVRREWPEMFEPEPPEAAAPLIYIELTPLQIVNLPEWNERNSA